MYSQGAKSEQGPVQCDKVDLLFYSFLFFLVTVIFNMCHTASFDLTLQSLILLWYCSMLWEEEPSVATTLPSPAAVPASPPEWIWPWLSYFRLFPLWGKWSMGGVWCYSLHGSIQLNYLETWFTVHSICWFRVCYMVSEYICDAVVKGCVYEEYGVQGRTGQGLLFHRSFFG